MTVYVDPLFNSEGMSAKWPYKYACHCWADSIEELKVFCVNKLHLREEWFQDKPFFPHFDLTSGTRRRAINLGAKSVSQMEAVHFRNRNKAKAHLASQKARAEEEGLLRGNNPELSLLYNQPKTLFDPSRHFVREPQQE